jgi:hypothetical protein
MIIFQGMNNLQRAFIPRALGQVVEEALRHKSCACPHSIPARPVSHGDQMTSRARVEDIRSLESFLDEYPKQAPIWLLFYGGEETLRKMVIP